MLHHLMNKLDSSSLHEPHHDHNRLHPDYPRTLGGPKDDSYVQPTKQPFFCLLDRIWTKEENVV
jgi:hypothetical protein